MKTIESPSRYAAPVRVSVPFDVASDLGSFKKAVDSVLGKLGCQACCSGFDIHFDIERDFHIDRDLNVKGVSQLAGALRTANPTSGPGRTFVLDAAVANDKTKLFGAIDKIASFGGCDACCSGHDLFFEMNRGFLINSKLEAVGFA